MITKGKRKRKEEPQITQITQIKKEKKQTKRLKKKEGKEGKGGAGQQVMRGRDKKAGKGGAGQEVKRGKDKKEKETYVDYEIELLSNSHHFFLQYAFIIFLDEGYWLMALPTNGTPYEGIYNSIRGAKIAFARLFKNKCWRERRAKPEWTPKYSPLSDWMLNNLRLT